MTDEPQSKTSTGAYHRGTCSNCERGPLALHRPYELCSSCKAHITGVSPYQWDEALAEARAKYKGKPIIKTGGHYHGKRIAAAATA